MPSCGAPNCYNRSSTHSGVSFHRLPPIETKKELRDMWIAQLKRKTIPKYLNICSDHFEKDCFQRDLKAELLGYKPRNTLKHDAVPTIFSHTAEKRKERSPSAEKEEQVARKKLVEEISSNEGENVKETSASKHILAIPLVMHPVTLNTLNSMRGRRLYHSDNEVRPVEKRSLKNHVLPSSLLGPRLYIPQKENVKRRQYTSDNEVSDEFMKKNFKKDLEYFERCLNRNTNQNAQRQYSSEKFIQIKEKN